MSASFDWRVRLGVFLGILLGCSSTTAPPEGTSFESLRAELSQACGSCHGAGSGRFFLVTMDSADLVESGLLNPADPVQSLLNLKPSNLIPHGGGLVEAYTAVQERLTGWIANLPPAGPFKVEAIKVGAGTSIAVPTIDGFRDPVWSLLAPVKLRVSGGWGEAEFVEVRAAYDGTYLYMLMVWVDDKASVRRQPWVKQPDGTWKSLAAKTPAPAAGSTWAHYMGNGLNEEDATRFAYEDKFAIIWNTYGASTVAGFEQSGCSVLCHDPTQANRPGTTYNLSEQWNGSKKYTNAPNEIADMWHWKLVRNNQHYKADDQWVGYWVVGPAGSGEGGRFGDAGGSGYASNPSIGGFPQYRGPSMSVPPYYIYDNQKVLLTSSELTGLAAGSEVANMITTGPGGFRADVDARGFHNQGSWNLEIRRKLVTGDVNDVQFDDLLREYAFGVALFDNAQIEHRYLATVAKLVFKQ